MLTKLKGQKKLEHLFNLKTLDLVCKGFKYGLSVEDLAYLLAVEPALVEEMIRMVIRKGS